MPERVQTRVLELDPYEPEIDKISLAAEALRMGRLVAFPTETVYGLGADLKNEAAVNRVYEVKGRPRAKPLSIHIADFGKLDELATDIPQSAYKLIRQYWPGPVTIVLKDKTGGKVGLRFPRNQIAYALIRESGLLIVAPSANLSDLAPPKTAKDVLRDLNGLVDIVLDGGKTEIGIESTVVDLTTTPHQVLREGAVSSDRIKKAVETKVVLFVCTGNTCRSVMAAGLLRKALAGRDDIDVVSAGVSAIAGYRATQETIEVMREEGMDVSNHRTQGLTRSLIKASDIIFAMEPLHKERILEKVPEASSRVHLLKEYNQFATPPWRGGPTGLLDAGIPDPIGKPIEDYRESLKMIKECVERVAKSL